MLGNFYLGLSVRIGKQQPPTALLLRVSPLLPDDPTPSNEQDEAAPNRRANFGLPHPLANKDTSLIRGGYACIACCAPCIRCVALPASHTVCVRQCSLPQLPLVARPQMLGMCPVSACAGPCADMSGRHLERCGQQAHVTHMRERGREKKLSASPSCDMDSQPCSPHRGAQTRHSEPEAG